MLAGAGIALQAAAVLAAIDERAGQQVTVAVGGALALIPLGLLAATARGVGGMLLRLLLLPAWLVGAVPVSVGALLLAPFLGTARLAGMTLASAIEVVRPSRRV
ncbi:MAG: hypothetical protein H0V19_05800 [Euzebyales bacterium]|nr:hypothetical protein [Euzebyales bacterium]